MEDDDNTLCRFGTALTPLEEDEVPSKKPIQIEDQIVTDENGKRRFHGAFTGGFSAGFWNTVGSLEGWHPKEFKSSRLEKAERHQQKPSDFMDAEDLGEFGIAPQRVQTTEDFTPQDRKRKLQQKNDGPIPGVPVLEQLLRPAKENVAIRLLKKMGWKPGQGIGARQTRREKRNTAKRNEREQYIMKHYGCDIAPKIQNDNNSESDLSDEEEITFAPDDFEPYVCAIKDNTFGLGYAGLCRDPILKNQHVNLFGPLEIVDNSNKKLSIRGQAFGVGALEEEDEDIYHKEDMGKYDFTLSNASSKEKLKKTNKVQQLFVIDGFHLGNENSKNIKKIFSIQILNNFIPRNWALRKTRFEPLDDSRVIEIKKINEIKNKGLGRHDLNPNERGQILGESSLNVSASSSSTTEKLDNEVKLKAARNQVLDMITAKFDNFTKTETINEDGSIERNGVVEGNQLDKNVLEKNKILQQKAKKITDKFDKSSGIFKPFAVDIGKQERYEKFLAENFKNINDNEEITKFLTKIQPIEMSDWDREMEKQEFRQAQKIYQPLKGLMNDRFITESEIKADREEINSNLNANKPIEAVRTRKMWKPCSTLCKKFNLAEPFGGTMIEEKVEKKPKFSIFDYLETSVNTKNNFVTPVIIPKNVEKSKPIVKQRVTAKDLFTNEMQNNVNKQSNVSDNDQKSEANRQQNSQLLLKDMPKTELEMKIEETKNVHPSQKKDLFKSIFDDSSDEESTEKSTIISTTQKPIPQNILEVLTKPAQEMNLLRSNSPHRGIFAAYFEEKNKKKDEPQKLDKIKPQSELISVEKNENVAIPPKILFKSKKNRDNDNNVEENDAIYGPKIPTQLRVESSNSDRPIAEAQSTLLNTDDEKLLKLLKNKKKKSKVIEEWVVKTDNSNDFRIDKKKKKKEKHKKKKSKKHKK